MRGWSANAEDGSEVRSVPLPRVGGLGLVDLGQQRVTELRGAECGASAPCRFRKATFLNLQYINVAFLNFRERG